jgi:glycosyltransferase involved in cell wall biosynthesis
VDPSAAPRARRKPPAGVFRVAGVGHLREEKDPFRAAAALAYLPDEPAIEVIHVGAAIELEMAREARRRMRDEPRYRWLGGLPHGRALAWLARSHLLVVSSRMEGGANVIAEAARLGTPVLASSVPGNIGMLGRGYPGYFPLGDERSLARLMARAAREPAFYRRLRRTLAARRQLFAPAAERAALVDALRSLMHRSGQGSGAARR